MKKIINLILLSSFTIFLNCTIYGLTNDYTKLTQNEKILISKFESFEKLEIQKIYQINPKQLKKEIQKHPKSLVYVFKNGCTSKLCLPMNVYINFAEVNDYQLFMVMDGFANLQETLSQDAETPYFAIDNDYYGISNRNKYIRYFENELMNLPKETKHKEYLGNLFFFENGKFVNVEKELVQ